MERGHDEHVGGVGQAAERIEPHHVAVERHVGRHVAVVLEIDAAAVEDFDRLAHLLGALAVGVAERRVGEQGDARLDAEVARRTRRLDRDVGEFLGRRHLMHAGVGDQHRATAADRQRAADQAPSGLGVDDAADIAEHAGRVARHARHHHVGVAVRDHQRREHVALVDHETIAVAAQEALALEPLEQEVGEFLGVGRAARVDQLELATQRDALLLEVGLHRLRRADQDRDAEALVEISVGGANDGGILALGEDHALGLAAHLLERRL